MARQIQRADPVLEAKREGMAVSELYDIPGRGKVSVATDLHFGDNYEEFARYVYNNRHDPSKVRFIRPGAHHIYASSKEQDTIAWGIAREEGVAAGFPPPASFREEKEREERAAGAPRQREAETEVFFIRYGGNPVRIEVDISYMGQEEKEELRAGIKGLGLKPEENALFNFIERYHSHIDNIVVEVAEGSRTRRVQVGMGEVAETISDLERLRRQG